MEKSRGILCLLSGIVLLMAGVGITLGTTEFSSNAATADFVSYSYQWESAACYNQAFTVNDVSAQPTGTAVNAVRLVGQGFCRFNMTDLEQTDGTYRLVLRLHRADCADVPIPLQILGAQDSNTGQQDRFFH